MKAEFTKMHGCGNDYIYFNCMQGELYDPETISIRLSDRHFGIGGDGIVMICSSKVADAKMRMFNADGSEGKMCGNAIRCVGKYLSDKGLCSKDIITVETLSGIKTLDLHKQNNVVVQVSVDMGKAELDPQKIPVVSEQPRIIDYPLAVDGEDYRISCVSMGNPHCVIFVEDPDRVDLEKIGPKFEYHSMFPERINTEFVQLINPSTLKMRVWERGSGETWACGTGACASVAAAVENGLCPRYQDITVKLRGGDLVINYSDSGVRMTGPAETVFEGIVEI